MSERVILVDDHTLLREGLRRLVESELGMTVIAQAGDGRTAVRLVLEHHPDLVIMDITMPDLNGVDATRRILEQMPDIKVIALSMRSEKDVVTKMLAAGASAYILKDCAVEELGVAVQAVRNGLRYISPGVMGPILTEYLGHEKAGVDAGRGELTPREREVLQLVAGGKSTKEIAEILFVSAPTVESHRKHLMDKLNLHTIADLTKYAIKAGLIPLE